MERRGDLVMDEALSWLKRNPRRPLFLWVHLYDPHHPYTPPEPYASRYRATPYDGEIAFADAQVGRLFAYLRERRLYDDALIVLASDHGEGLGEHGEKTHGFFIYSSTLQVPLILRIPGVAPRVDTCAKKYEMMVGFHGHDNTRDPDEFSTPETFARAMEGASKHIGVNLDIGHFTAAGGDPLEYIREHHDRIVTLHIKDRKKEHGANLPFGEGETPIGPVLRLLRDNGWRIPANIEYEYGKSGMDAIVEVKKCFEFCRKELEA